MEKEEAKNIEYLSKVFKRLSKERKEDLLHSARQLLKIQDSEAFPMLAEKPVSQNEAQRAV